MSHYLQIKIIYTNNSMSKTSNESLKFKPRDNYIKDNILNNIELGLNKIIGNPFIEQFMPLEDLSKGNTEAIIPYISLTPIGGGILNNGRKFFNKLNANTSLLSSTEKRIREQIRKVDDYIRNRGILKNTSASKLTLREYEGLPKGIKVYTKEENDAFRKKFQEFLDKYEYNDIDLKTISDDNLERVARDIINQHNTYVRGVRIPEKNSKDYNDILKKLGHEPTTEEILKEITVGRPDGVYISTGNKMDRTSYVSDIYGDAQKVQRRYNLGTDRMKWFEKGYGDFDVYGITPETSRKGFLEDILSDKKDIIVAPWEYVGQWAYPVESSELFGKNLIWKGPINNSIPSHNNIVTKNLKNGGYTINMNNRNKRRLVINTSIGLTPNIIRGGNAIAEGDGVFRINQFNKNKNDDVYIGKTLAVDDKEKLMIDNGNLKVLSDDLKINGLSPVETSDLLRSRGVPNRQAFNIAFDEQELYKELNGIKNKKEKGQNGLLKYIKGLFSRDNSKEEINEQVNDEVEDELDLNSQLDLKDIASRQLFMESEFNPKAVSNKNANGLFQITQIALDEYNKNNEDKYTLEDMFDIDKNIKVRNWYFDYQGERGPAINPKNLPVVKLAKQLAGYNMGSPALGEYLVKQRDKKGVDIYNTLDWVNGLDKETRDYINFIIKHKDVSKYKTNENYQRALEKYKDINNYVINKLKYGGSMKDTSITPNIKHNFYTGGKIKTAIGDYVMDWVNPVINTIGAGVSYGINKNYLNKYRDLIRNRKRIDIQPIKLKTNFNINPQLTDIDRNEEAVKKMIQENTASSQSLTNRLVNNRQYNTLQRAKLLGEKENIETGLINADRQLKYQNLVHNTNRQDDLETQKFTSMADVYDKQSVNAQSLIKNVASAIDSGFKANMMRRADATNKLTKLLSTPDMFNKLASIVGMNEDDKKNLVRDWIKRLGIKFD